MSMKDKIHQWINLENRVIRLYYQLKSGKISMIQIGKEWISDIKMLAQLITEGDFDPTDEGLKSLIMITLDQYTYSDDGTVFITDHEYDILHEIWKMRGHQPLIYADIFKSEWNMVHHDAPWMVGSVQKVYDMEDLADYIENINVGYGMAKSVPVQWVVAPKFDGISANLKIQDNKLVQAITRGDRDMGQDITEVLMRCGNLHEVLHWKGHSDGYLKVELCVPTSEFAPLKEQGYANRRSATSAIVNSPKNINNACHIHAVPLLWYGEDGIDYDPQDSVHLKTASVQELLDMTTKIISKVKSPEYEFRADGAVLYPMITDMNTEDVMQHAIAFKINTAQASTRIKRGYVSMGRTGYAVPMIEVEPCDVNETVVTDVSLGSFGKFYQMGLHENEEVIIYSAGDVIPQMRQYDPPKYPKGSDYLDIPEICPYCGAHLENAHCVNPDCVRKKTGRITNFIQKLGVEDISDSTIELLYEKRVIRDLTDIFRIRESDLNGIESIGKTKASNIIREIDNLQKKPITNSEFFGALGCPGVSEKISQAIFQVVPIEYLLSEARPIRDTCENNSLRNRLYQISGIGENRANIIVNFVYEHRYEIETLMSMMHLTEDVQYKGAVVFSGFRDKNWVEKFKTIGIRVSETLNRNTIMVIAANLNTGKAKKAMATGIPVMLYADIEEAYEMCSKI